MKEKLLLKLDRYNYRFSLVENDIVVWLGFSQRVRIDLSQANKIVMTDEFVGWNFLTGFFCMSLKKTMVFNTIGLLIAIVLVSLIESKIETRFLSVLAVFIIGMFVMWTSYYLIKLESFKRQVISWTDDR